MQNLPDISTFRRGYAAALKRHGKMCAVTLLCCILVPMLVLVAMPKRYVAKAVTQVTKDEIAVELGVIGEDRSRTTVAQQHAARFRDLMTDDRPDAFLDLALKGAGLAKEIDIRPTMDDPRLKQLREDLSVAPISNESFAITLTWDNQAEAEKIVDSFRREYIEAVGAIKEMKSKKTLKFLDDQIRRYAQRMRAKDEALIRYRQANAGNSPEQEVNEIKQLSALKSQRDDLRIRSQDGIREQAAILARLKKISPQSILEKTIGQDPASKQIESLEAEREVLLSEYTPASDEVRAVDAKIAALRKLQARKAKGTDAGVLETKLQENPEYQALSLQLTQARIDQETDKAQLAIVQKRIAEYEARIQKMPAAQRLLAERTRDAGVLKEQYESLLKQRESARVKGSLDGLAARSDLNPVGVVHALSTTGKKEVVKLFAASCLLGVIASVLLFVLREWSDQSIYFSEDAERILGLPVLGSIPSIPASMPALPAVNEVERSALNAGNEI